MHPAHVTGRFLVPMTGQSPDVGSVAPTYTESVQDEIAELAAANASHFSGAQENPFHLVQFGMAVVAMLERRATADVADFRTGVAATPKPTISPEQERRIVAANLGRFLDWICKGRRVLDMGPRAFVVASHVRAAAIDYRTDQQAAHEIGNDTRASINKIKSEFRRSFGADYAGENGKGSNTKTRCKNSRIEQLKS